MLDGQVTFHAALDVDDHARGRSWPKPPALRAEWWPDRDHPALAETRRAKGAGPVWLLEDHDDLREMLTLYFAANGYAVEPFASQDALLTRLALSPGACGSLVVDAWTARDDEVALLRQVPARRCAVLVDSLALAYRWLDCGAAYLLLKPVSPDQIVAALEGITEPPPGRAAPLGLDPR